MNLCGCKVNLPTITEKDEDDIVNFGLKEGVDMIAASFVRSGRDVERIRDLLGPKGANIRIISKIENEEGLENFEEILEARQRRFGYGDSGGKSFHSAKIYD